MRIWDSGTGKELARVPVLNGAGTFQDIQISRDGRRIFVRWKKAQELHAAIWDMNNPAAALKEFSTQLDLALPTPDGKHVLVHLRDRGMILVETESGKTVREYAAASR